MALTPKESRLAAALLELASDQFSNHGCNDMETQILSEFTEEEKIDICLDINRRNGDDCGLYFDSIPDWLWMQYLADKLKEDNNGA